MPCRTPNTGNHGPVLVVHRFDELFGQNEFRPTCHRQEYGVAALPMFPF